MTAKNGKARPPSARGLLHRIKSIEARLDASESPARRAVLGAVARLSPPSGEEADIRALRRETQACRDELAVAQATLKQAQARGEWPPKPGLQEMREQLARSERHVLDRVDSVSGLPARMEKLEAYVRDNLPPKRPALWRRILGWRP